MLGRALTLSAILSLAAAQITLSSSCESTLTEIAINPDANACLVPTPLITLLTNSNASVVQPINSWLTGLCAAPACSNSTLSAIVTNATAGCSAELAAIGLSSSDNTAVVSLVQEYYPIVRQTVCLQDGNTNCITQTLTNLQSVLGTLTLSSVISLVTSSSTPDLPSNVTCTDCVKAIYNTVNTEVPGLIDSSSLSTTCGSSFVDGATPSDITESASNSTASSTTSTSGNGAAQLSLGALSGASIVAAIFALVA
ncbi:hypothetical protein H0H92_014399 [Tricholoma furcatifolium]|nr:hypothetical protein H0H92_014399 [Tricholoma furcatifolium]